MTKSIDPVIVNAKVNEATARVIQVEFAKLIEAGASPNDLLVFAENITVGAITLAVENSKHNKRKYAFELCGVYLQQIKARVYSTYKKPETVQ